MYEKNLQYILYCKYVDRILHKKMYPIPNLKSAATIMMIRIRKQKELA